MNAFNKTILATSLLLASTGLANAAMTATTVTDMTIYSGPGADYEQVGLATRGSTGVLDGCLDGGAWCRIDVNGMRGWVYAESLTVDQGGSAMSVTKYGKAPVVTYEKTGSSTVVVTPQPQPGPNDQNLGAVEDVGHVTPPGTVITYMQSNPADDVVYQGDIAVGTTLPPGATFRKIPDYKYSYTRINDRQVLVDPGTRRVVYVYE
jgi:uncharacterized protein YraI